LLRAKVAAGSRHAWWLIVAGLTGWKEIYWACRRKSARFRMPQGWTASLISFFSWWNKENRVLILPILNKFLVITEAAQQTYAGPNDNKTKQNTIYSIVPNLKNYI
jgi:hypothetical protein